MPDARDPVNRDIVLVGGGHAHVEVLRRFGQRRPPGVRLTLVARDVLTPYSGALPGLLAGHYSHEEAHIDLRRLAAATGARLYHATATGLDLARQRVLCAGRPPVPFDGLSIDIGSSPDASGIEGAAEFGLPVKPVGRFLEGWARIRAAVQARATAGEPFRIAVIGGGAGGVELILALRHRLAAETGTPDRVRFTLLAAGERVLAGHGAWARRRMAGILAAKGIAVAAGRRVVRLTGDAAVCADGARFPADAVILATHAAAPGWLAGTGLALDGAGFIRVDASLRSVSHGAVFAAGDVAAVEGHALPKSGVYAVRQGPILAENLRRCVEGRALLRYRPQRRALSLVSTGDRHALASYGPVALAGNWVWRIKDRIDRRWLAMYRHPGTMGRGGGDGGAPHAFEMRCGGCGAKVPSRVLRRVLDRIETMDRPDVLCGLAEPDDAAIVTIPADRVLVQTVDHFRAFLDDPYLFGRITANHCLGDVFAMGATPHSALALVGLPYGPEDKVAEDLFQILAGALETLREAGAALVGGHTGEAAEMSFGLSVNGLADPARLLRKGGARPGDALILTKPLGTGAILAAAMRGAAPAPWIDGAIRTMLASNGPAARCLMAHGTRACTDVTGFGFLGHLLEMASASGVDAEIDLAALPALDGALPLLRGGFASSLHPANAAFGASMDGATGHPAGPLLFDPQTAGGLLAAVPGPQAAECLAALHAMGLNDAAAVGRIRPRAGTTPRIETAG